MLTTASQTPDTGLQLTDLRHQTSQSTASLASCTGHQTQYSAFLASPSGIRPGGKSFFFLLYYVLFCCRWRRPETKTSNSSVAPQIDPGTGESEWWCVRNGKLTRPACIRTPCVCSNICPRRWSIAHPQSQRMSIHGRRGCLSTPSKMPIVRPLGFQPSR